jgi:surface protein
MADISKIMGIELDVNSPAPIPPSFVSSWDTTKTGDSPAKTIALPLFDGGTYNFTVDYGDNSGEKTVTSWDDADAMHTYADDGVYEVTIRGQIEGFMFGGGGDCLRLVEISNWGPLKVGTTQGGYFAGCENLVVTADDTLDTSAVTNMSYMFYYCFAFNGSVANFDTSNVTTMFYMFGRCSVFNQSVASWDTSNVTDMSRMFEECSVFNQSVANFDTSNVTTMLGMFYSCFAFNQSVASWDTSNVTDMSYMFDNANALSQANYDATLIAWAGITQQNSVPFHAGDATYSAGAATTARGVLTGTYNWSITDGGQN